MNKRLAQSALEYVLLAAISVTALVAASNLFSGNKTVKTALDNHFDTVVQSIIGAE